MHSKAAIFSYIICYAKHVFIFVENNYLIWFDYTDFLILINPFATPGIGKFALSTLSPEVSRR